MELHHGADRLGELDGPADILDHRDVPEYRAAALGEQRCRDHLESGILGALHENGPMQRITATDVVAGLRTAGHRAGTPVRRVQGIQYPTAAESPGPLTTVLL